MRPEDTVKLIQMRRNPVNSLQDLNQKLIGTREGFIFYTSNFRNDFETKMYMLGHLEQENQQLKSTLEEIREYINSKVISNGEIIDQLRKTEVKEILQIIDKGVNND